MSPSDGSLALAPSGAQMAAAIRRRGGDLQMRFHVSGLSLQGLGRVRRQWPEGRTEADGHAVVGVHQADRDGEVHELALVEDGACGLVGLVGHVGLRDARDRLGPCKGGAFARIEEITGFPPRLKQRELLDADALLDQVARCGCRGSRRNC